MKYKVWYIVDGYCNLLNYVIEPKGKTFAEKFNSIVLQLDEKITKFTPEGRIERYYIDHIEEVNEEGENV